MNLNNNVEVILTDHGKDIRNKYIRKLETELHGDFSNLHKYDKDGKLVMQLYDLMYMFGKYVIMGSPQVFKDNEIKQIKSKNKLINLRDELYESIPCGTVKSFDLIKIIKAHIKKLDEIIDLE